VDLYGGDAVNTDDFLSLSDAFDTTPSDTKWNIQADIDGNGVVNTDDYLILSDNFDVAGDE